MSLVHSFSVGEFRCHALEAGTIRLDGGAVFGIVPKPVWARRLPPDDRNRVRLAMRCLLVEHPDGLTLIDTGLGNKEDRRFLELYGVENAGRDGRSQLEDALAEAGHRPAEVRWVINTHLHFDHAGGNTWEEHDEAGVAVGGARLTFPNANYVVQRDELEFARNTNERTKGSYFAANFEPVAEAGRWRLLRGEVDVLPGISVRLTPGHVPHHQSVLIESGADSLVFLADVMPTSHHLQLPWIMGFDLEQLRTLESKRRLLKVAADEGRWLFFEHDPEIIMGRVGEGDRGTALGDLVRVGGVGFEGV
ncbi:MAG: MBL fold metallo-hydrolase [Gemmatimonadetes bacterium]|nr:MBL fold metallo-hydrolase [Gemmatimonadota bacterium]